ncbi:uncharacterized protein LOC123923047 isoform X2 [Trifolium pratense]|uniref:uncharacterized protein LOC123923047 isoform X2 n=1 Tax=Trifolium pratense TaxID=57577 RepID=UPI001E690D4D|nr:uncharacterized protein LOC123923047 isoform X2 [Trifolium pratense]
MSASRPRGFAQRYCEPLVSSRDGDFGSSAVGLPHVFLLKVAALETVRRFSKSRCPCVWRGLQSLRILVLPQFKWIQRWAAFRGLVKRLQVLSRPLFILSIGTVFTDELECSDGTSDHITNSRDSEISAAEPSPVQDNMNISGIQVQLANKVVNSQGSTVILKLKCDGTVSVET